MKKIVFGFIAASMLVMGAASVQAAPGAACEGNVDASCTVTNADGSTSHCTIYVNGVDAAADQCTDLGA